MTVEDHQAAGHSSPPNNGLGRGSGSSCDPVGQAPNVTIKSSQSSWMPGVDVKSDGGYVILPERAGVILCLPDPPRCRSDPQARLAAYRVLLWMRAATPSKIRLRPNWKSS